MPQASDELRQKMQTYFGDSIDDSGPTKFLKSKGWRETETGLWFSPQHIDHVSTQEFECLLFLRDEWDHAYAGVEVGS